MLLIF
ncbi:hypothetical protein SPV_2533 [Streptococcus pneumoniae]